MLKHRHSFMSSRLLSQSFALFSLAICLALTGCIGGPTKKFTVADQPVTGKAFSRPIDDENLEFIFAFKNQGTEIVSFDYTIADQPNVPHIDAGGPNSGLIENLYPGAQIELKNPYKTNNVYLALGKVVVGKSTPEQIRTRYNLPKPEGGVIPIGDLPPL